VEELEAYEEEALAGRRAEQEALQLLVGLQLAETVLLLLEMATLNLREVGLVLYCAGVQGDQKREQPDFLPLAIV
jgi:hypothetical protein